MGEVTVRRDRGLSAPRYQAAEKTERAGASRSRPAVKSPGFTVSETLRELMSRVGRAEDQTRESHRTLQTGEAVLAEVRDILGHMAELARKASSGEAADRAALQGEWESLRSEIDRMTGGAEAGGARLFLDGDMDVEEAEEAPPGDASSEADGARALPAWLLKGLARDGLTPERLLSLLGLDRSASKAELMAAVLGSSLEENAAAGYLAALYLGAVITGGASDKTTALEAALEGLRQFLEKVDGGMPPDQAVELLTNGIFSGLSDLEFQFTGGTAQGLQDFLTELLLSGGGFLPDASLLTLLAGLEGVDLELLMGLLAAVQSGGVELDSASVPEEAVPLRNAVLELEDARVTGRDLSGVSAGEPGGEVTVSGTADVTVQGTGERTLLLMGSGTVTLLDARGAALTADAPMARVSVPEEAGLREINLRSGASLTLSGGGTVRLAALRGDGSNTLRITGGAVAVMSEEGEALGTLAVPVVLEGPASLAAQALSVRDAAGRPLEPFDVVWQTLLPGWNSVTALAVNGRQTRLALAYPEHMRLWLDRGNPSHGSPIQAVVIRGRDRRGRSRVRYAYLRWDENAGAFEEVSMYPNPFTVTGGEAGVDWIYEEEAHALRVLTNQVTAITGGAGVDANRVPFSGRIVLEDGIGPIELTLGGVDCRVSSGRAFDLGKRNDVTLLLKDGTHSHFASGAGFAGISLGEGTSLSVDCPDGGTPVGALTAFGGEGGAGIGRDSGGGRDQTGRIVIRGGAVTASGSGGGAGIGGGKRGAVGEIVLLGGAVIAVAAGHAAAIGAGAQGSCGDILITGTARIVKAVSGDPGADIGAGLFGSCGEVRVSGGADIGRARLWTRTGIPLQMGEETVTLPQFRLSSRALGLDRLSVAAREAAKAAQAVIDADRRRVAQIQAAYTVLYDRLERNSCSLRGVQRYFRETGLVRDTAAAGTLLNNMRSSIPLSSVQAERAHGKRGKEDVRQLLR